MHHYCKVKPLAETCENIWNFIYTHVQYKLDRDGVEELRRPSRTWSIDRTTGVDCDCMSLFAGSILTNLGISFKFRVTKYTAGWQHVYVVVPLPENSSKYYVIDCVLTSFNEEKPYSGKFDHTMKTATLSGIPIAMLGSLGEATVEHSNDLEAILNGDHFDIDENFLGGLGNEEDIEKTMLDKFLDHLKASREYIAKNPDGLTVVGGAKTHLEMIDYAIEHWNTPQRDAALDALAKEEDRWNAVTAPINGVDDSSAEDDDDVIYIDGIGEIGKLKINIKAPGKKIFTAIKEGVNSVKVVAKKVAVVAKTNIKKAATVVKAAIKKVGEFLVKYNPVTLTVRAGFLAAMHVNLFGMAERLLPGLLTQSEAAAKGVPVDLWNKSKAGFEKVAALFEKIGGSRTKLIHHIKTGRAGKKSNLAGLGEPITTAVVITSAASTLLTAAAKMREAGVSAKQYKDSKKSLKGIGEVEDENLPEEEILDTDGAGKVVEDKKGIAKFIEAIRKWFSKNKHADVDTTAIVKEEEKIADPDSATPEGGGDDEPVVGFFAQVTNFVKNNPGKTAAIGLTVAAAVAFAFSPKLRAVVGFGPKKKAALSGPGKKKKANKANKSHAKRIELK
ncbi:MAG: hypothetical protein K8R85_00625 [Bacteroidetes bacterium]|nr:hypothetical protein [Bacteroidota bacterium]